MGYKFLLKKSDAQYTMRYITTYIVLVQLMFLMMMQNDMHIIIFLFPPRYVIEH